jgi:peroxiredoxin
MANQLTGAFEAVVQIAVRQINGLLGTLHQNGAAADAPLQLLHSVIARVGDPRRRPPDVALFGDWVLEYQKARSRGIRDAVRADLVGMAPPGAAQKLADAFAALDDVVVAEDPPDVERGTAKLQLATVGISVPSGSSSEVVVHAHVRGHYYPDPNTTNLPAPVHGDVEAAFGVRTVRSSAGTRLLIQPTSQDSKIRFIAAPGSGLSGLDVNRIAAQVRTVIREGITLLPVDLPRGFPFAEFKGVGTGDAHAVALGVQLSSATPPAGGLQNLTQSFVGPSGFALAVSKEFVLEVFKPTLDALRQFKRDFEVSILGPNPTYHFSVTGVELQFNNGSIDLVIKGKATHFLLPNFNNIVIRQRFRLVMFLETLFVTAPDDELTISGFPGASGTRPAIVAERDRALTPAQNALNTQLRDAMTRLNGALHSFDSSASASFRAGHSEEPGAGASGAVAITPDGVILRGDIAGGSRSNPVVHIRETDQRGAFTAFDSWIPAGRIDRFIWSWVEYGRPPSIWNGVSKSFTDEHRFIFPKPQGITELSQICLQIEGAQLLPDGRPVTIAAGTLCHVPEPEVLMDVPSWFEPVTVPIWLPDISTEITLRDAIAGHVNVQTDIPRKNELTQNSLVCFADWPRPLDVIADALSRMQRKSVPLTVIVVLPVGAFDKRRVEVEGTLARIRDQIGTRLHVTEDDEGAWTRTFATATTPSMYLINARRQFVWKYEGQPDAAALASALDEHLLPAPAPRGRPLRLAVALGDRAPDVSFHHDGHEFALHRLRGREVLVNFWQSWSRPCLTELRRLQGLYEERRDPPFIVAFHGGKDGKRLDTIRKEVGLSFALVADVEQQIARRYGVRCWPTTIRIDAQGRVGHVQFGVSREHDLARGTTKAGTS